MGLNLKLKLFVSEIMAALVRADQNQKRFRIEKV